MQRDPRVFRHILPNLTSPLLTLAILEFARIVLAEAALSFLGWASSHRRPHGAWTWPPARTTCSGPGGWSRFPGIAISLTVLAVNLVASWMRLVSDPQEREKQFARQMRARRKSSPVVQEGIGSMTIPANQPVLEIENLVVHFTTRSGIVQG